MSILSIFEIMFWVVRFILQIRSKGKKRQDTSNKQPTTIKEGKMFDPLKKIFQRVKPEKIVNISE